MIGEITTLAECPIGLFMSEHGELCLKTEYGDNNGRIDAYIVSSGEFFWGGARFAEDQRRVQVRPVDKDAMLASSTRAEALQQLLWLPEVENFVAGVVREAGHQRDRWGSAHDAGKAPEDWLWLLGYLAGKAVRADRDGEREKALHHCISSAAVLANWHARILGQDTSMRPGIELDERGEPAK